MLTYINIKYYISLNINYYISLNINYDLYLIML
jgi:hypothetical protein